MGAVYPSSGVSLYGLLPGLRLTTALQERRAEAEPEDSPMDGSESISGICSRIELLGRFC